MWHDRMNARQKKINSLTISSLMSLGDGDSTRHRPSACVAQLGTVRPSVIVTMANKCWKKTKTLT